MNEYPLTANAEVVDDARTEALKQEPERGEPDGPTREALLEVGAKLLAEQGVGPEVFVAVIPAGEFGQVGIGPNCYIGETPVVEVGAMNHPKGYRRWCAGGKLPDGTQVKAETEVLP
jgi:hypothetical protein